MVKYTKPVITSDNSIEFEGIYAASGSAKCPDGNNRPYKNNGCLHNGGKGGVCPYYYTTCDRELK